jgi:tetratricopeptide (TPR) repeat protein
LINRILLALLVVLAFGASATHGFHFDDVEVIHGAKWSEFETRPLTWLTFEANAALGTAPFLWHVVNLALHIAAVLLLYELLLWRAPAAALLAAAIFAVHPIQAESVAYVYSRATLLSTALSLLTMLCWVRGKRWLAVLSFAFALAAKEDCVLVPAVMLIVDYGAGKRKRDVLPYFGAMFLLAAAAGTGTLLATRAPHSGAGFTAGITWQTYLLDQGFVMLRYLRLLFFPYGFTIDPEIQITPMLALAAWAALAVLVYLATRLRAGYWFVAGIVLLLPSSSIFPAADLAADHRMYLPMIAFSTAIAVELARAPRWSQITVTAALMLISAARMSVWGDDAKLWAEAVARSPDKVRPRIQLARALDPHQAVKILDAAQTRFAGNPEIANERGRVDLELGHPEQALVEFGRVLAERPGDARAINNRAVALQAMGQLAVAQMEFRRALQLDACLEEARKNLDLAPCKSN